jgi:DNA gyrase subunit B
MYIGSTDSRGLHHLVTEIVDNSIDEALAGYCDDIRVRIQKDGSVSVWDNGRGIPVDIHPVMGKSALEIALTVLHAGGKFGGEGYKVSGGLHGVGVSVVNALSSYLRPRSGGTGRSIAWNFSRGEVISPLEVTGETDVRDTGTTIVFKPDPEIFETTDFSMELICTRMREMAFLNRGISISVDDERTGAHNAYCYSGGIVSFVQYLNKNKETLHEDPIYFCAEKDDAIVEVAMQYNDGYQENVLSYANNINTHEGGTHLSGFKDALTRVINNYAVKYKILKETDAKLSGEDVREGLAAIVSVKLKNPQFEGQTKTQAGQFRNARLPASVVSSAWRIISRKTPPSQRPSSRSACRPTARREAARKARGTDPQKKRAGIRSQPGKLADCSEKDAALCEIYLVEGDLRGGSAKMGG